MAAGMDADTTVEISARPVSQEPMVRTISSHIPPQLTSIFILRPLQYLIANLGLSNSFGKVDLEHLTFPTTMRIDWIRVYQPTDAINIGCDHVDFPTEAYINQCVLFLLLFSSSLLRVCLNFFFYEFASTFCESTSMVSEAASILSRSASDS